MLNVSILGGPNEYPATRASGLLIVGGAPPARLWTPAQGLSGLVVVARVRPLSLVVGGRVHEVVSSDVWPESGDSGRRRAVSLGGLGLIGTSRQGDPTRVIGHPELASGTSVRHRDTLYVSVSEAVYREGQGEENVEIHLTPTPEDTEALASVKVRARKRWDGDRLPDGWTRPLPPRAAEPKAAPRPGGAELTEELRALAERFRSKTGDEPH